MFPQRRARPDIWPGLEPADRPDWTGARADWTGARADWTGARADWTGARAAGLGRGRADWGEGGGIVTETSLLHGWDGLVQWWVISGARRTGELNELNVREVRSGGVGFFYGASCGRGQ